jgi:hypothetical protein
VAIDNPFDQLEMQHRPPASDVFGLVLGVAGSVLPGVGIVSALRQHFSTRGIEGRLHALFGGLKEQLEDTGRRLEEVESLLSPQAVDAFLAAVSETIQTNNGHKVERFAKVLAGAVITDNDWLEVEAFIRDLGRLTDEDVKALALLAQAQEPLAISGRMPTEPNAYTASFTDFCQAIDRHGFAREEFYSLAARLSGFGLSAVVERNPVSVSLGDQCFRLTSRGLRLIRLLRGSAVPKTP